MQIIVHPSEFHINIPYNHYKARNTNAIKALSQRRFDYQKKCWIVPRSLQKEIEEIAQKHRAEVLVMKNNTPQVVGEIEPLPDLDIEIPLSHPQGFNLREYQGKGVARGLQLKKYINGDEQGLGKTIQSIATLYAAKLRGEDPFPVLIICPASMKQTWQREWHQWTKIKALILNDSNKTTWPRFHEMGMADVFITNYESLKKFFVAYMPPKGKMRNSMDIQMRPNIDLFKSIVIDESHRVKDTATQQSKLCLRIAMKKEWVILLTGTPVVNKPIDLYPQLGIMGQLGKFGGVKGYKMRYCNGGSGSSNLKELNYKLNKYCFFRREKKDVAKDLPEKQRQTILCDITTRIEYNRAKNDFVKHLEAMNFNEEEIARKMRGEIMVKMGELKRISALGKLNEVKEFVNEVINSGEKLIVFCSLHAIVDAMKKEYPDAVTVTGRDSMEQKQYSIDKFQRDPECKLIICNIKAAGVGITLTASSRVAFIEYPWTYADCVQCEDRCIAEGQLVLTHKGHVPIENVRIGDMVYTHKGNFKNVTDTWNRLERKKYFVDVNYMGFDIPLTCTNDHRIFVYNKLNDEFQWIEASEINPVDHMLTFTIPNFTDNELTKIELELPYGQDYNHRNGTTMSNGRAKDPVKEVNFTNDLMYAFGWYLAEGWSVVAEDKGSFVAVCGNTETEKQRVQKVSEIIRKSFGLVDSEVYTNDSKKNCSSSYVYSKNLAFNFIKWFGEKATDKHIPDFVFFAPDEFKRSFLNGYYDGDGYRRKNTQQATTASDKIALGLCLLESHFKNPITLRKSVKNHWSFEYSIPELTTRNPLIFEKEGYILFPVSEVKKYKPKRGKERVYDLTVQDDNSFVVGLSNVHNCHRIGQTNNVMCTYFLGADTIDEQMFELIKSKANTANAITGATDQMETSYIDKMISMFKD